MKLTLMIHMKSGKTAGFTADADAVKSVTLRYADWLSVGDETEAPIIDARDHYGAGIIAHFSNIECLEIEAR